MAYIEERKNEDGSTSYRAQIRIKGQKQVTATFERKTDAKEWARETETAIKRGKYFKAAEAKKHTVAEMIDRYIRDILPIKKDGLRSQKAQLEWWKGRLGHLCLADVTSATIVECRDELTSGTTRRNSLRSGATTNRYLAALSHVFTIAIKDWGWMEESPIARVSKMKESRGRVRYLTSDERAKLLNSCKESRCPYLYPIVVLALSTGLRKNEILRLRWSNVDLVKGRAIIEETKNGKTHAVPLVGHALETIRQLSNDRKSISPLLFPSSDQSTEKPYDIRTSWENALKRANIKNFTLHDLRHDRASTLAAGGASLAQIAEVLNHKTLQMVKRYAHLTECNVAGILERLDQEVFGSNRS